MKSKTKALISYVITAKLLICVFLFAYAKTMFSHDVAHFGNRLPFMTEYTLLPGIARHARYGSASEIMTTQAFVKNVISLTIQCHNQNTNIFYSKSERTICNDHTADHAAPLFYIYKRCINPIAT